MKMNISQQILALDARYNAYRVPNNPQYRKYSSLKAAFKCRTLYLIYLCMKTLQRLSVLFCQLIL